MVEESKSRPFTEIHGYELERTPISVFSTTHPNGTRLSTIHATSLRAEAAQAFFGAKESRDPGTLDDILESVIGSSRDVDDAISKIFVNYGHASVADMAIPMVWFDGIPMWMAYSLFGDNGVHAGQEKSSRFQLGIHNHGLFDLAGHGFHIDQELEDSYNVLAARSANLFQTGTTLARDALEAHFGSPKKRSEESTLNARALDVARDALLLGARTGMAIRQSARTWSETISRLKGSGDAVASDLGDQLIYQLAPPEDIERERDFIAQAPGLIKHTEADPTIARNLSNYRRWLADRNLSFEGPGDVSAHALGPGKQLLLHYTLAAQPGSDPNEVLRWIDRLGTEETAELGELLLSGHDRHHQLDDLARGGSIDAFVSTSIGDIRDFNRHRAWGRSGLHRVQHGPLTFDDARRLLNRPLHSSAYLEVPGSERFAEYWCEKLEDLRELSTDIARMINERTGPTNAYLNVLPLALDVPFVMSGGVRDASYFTNLRERPGGRIDYRITAARISQEVADLDPMLEPLRIETPDAADTDQFWDRS